MARIKVNLDEISDSFEILEPGRYTAKVVEIEEGDSAKGNPMLTWTWKIAGPGAGEGKELKSFTSLLDNALFGLKEHLTAFGLKGEVNFDTDKLIGKSAILVIGKQTIKSRTTGEDIEVNRIVNVHPVAKTGAAAGKPSVTVSKADDDDLPFPL